MAIGQSLAPPGNGRGEIPMTPERWQQVKAIFDQAVDREPAARAAFLRERCGNDEELQREVESLLASDQETGSLLENPLIGQATVASLLPAPSPADGDSFGPYVPVRVLGEGGMGTVYLARQQQPIRREVARSEEHTSELQSPCNLVCRLL